MAARPLEQLPDGSDVFIDANVFVYGLNGQSIQCKNLLEKCSREEVTGVSLFEIVNEATHRFMLAEALSKGLIKKESAGDMRKHAKTIIPSLADYWLNTERILSLNLLLLPTDDSMLRQAQVERRQAGLLTNDSMIISCMRIYGLTSLATRDKDFHGINGIVVFQPGDLP